MINVKTKKCQCGKARPYFNYPGAKVALCCKQCKSEGMVDVKSPKCQCGKSRPLYNYITETRPEYCKMCKMPNMINIMSPKCCVCRQATPTFNMPTEKQAKYCGKCKLSGMIDVSTPKCFCGKAQPSFNMPGEKSKRYCDQCKLPGMVNLKATKCHCGKAQPNYNKPGETKALYCARCKLPGMVNIHIPLCRCGTKASYGLPGKQPTHCAQHKHEVEGMLSDPRRRCQGKHIHNQKRCTFFATHGTRSAHAEYCDVHAPEGYIALTNYKCKQCGSYEVLSDARLCGICDPTLSLRFRKAKERQVKAWLDQSNVHADYKTNDVRLPTEMVSDCDGRLRRPDFLYNCDTHMVIVEVDEHEHQSACKRDEIKRMADIAQALGMATTFIRYNPDEFYTITNDTHDLRFKAKANKRRNVADGRRRKVLFEMIAMAKRQPGKLFSDDFLQVVYVFYSGDKPSQNRHLNPIPLQAHL